MNWREARELERGREGPERKEGWNWMEGAVGAGVGEREGDCTGKELKGGRDLEGGRERKGARRREGAGAERGKEGAGGRS